METIKLAVAEMETESPATMLSFSQLLNLQKKRAYDQRIREVKHAT